MHRYLQRATVLIAALSFGSAAGAAWQGNTPCSQSKGGVVACQGGKFLCKDGTISASKRTCSAADITEQPKAQTQSQPKAVTPKAQQPTR